MLNSIKSSILITLGMLVYIGLNFIFQILLVSKFGAGLAMDAFLSSNSIPFLINAILVSSISFTFIPVFTDYMAKTKPEQLWHMASDFFNITAVFLSILVIVGIIFAVPIIHMIVPGLSDQAKELVNKLFVIQLVAVVFISLGGLCASIYYTEGRFLRPTCALLINILVMIVIVWATSANLKIVGVALAYLIGGIFQFLWLCPAIFKKGRYKFCFDYTHPAIRRILFLILPLLLGAFFCNADAVVDRFIASSLSEGSISYLGYGRRIIIVLSTLAATGIATTSFPLMSKKFSQGNIAELKETFSQAILIVLFLCAPIVVTLAIMSGPLVQLIFQRGVFSPTDALILSRVLIFNLGTFLFGTLGIIFAKMFYAMQDTKTPTFIGASVFVLSIFIKFSLSLKMSFLGIALGSSICVFLGLSGLAFILHKKLKGLGLYRIKESTAKIVFSALLMGIVLFVSHSVPLKSGLQTIIFLVVGTLTYLLSSYLLGLKEMRLVFRAASQKVGAFLWTKG